MKKQSKEELLLRLSNILLQPYIKTYINEIGEIRGKLIDYTTELEELNITNRIKDKIQDEAYNAWVAKGRRGAILLATRVGKTKIGIRAIEEQIARKDSSVIVLAVPTQHLRDVTWREEFKKWSDEAFFDDILPVCYTSLVEVINTPPTDLVILDEGHNITTDNAEFFDNNRVQDILVVTATRPTEQHKLAIYRRLKVQPVYELTLDEAVTLGIVSPYEVTVVEIELDDTSRYIYTRKGGAAKTEKEAYNHFNRMVFATTGNFARISRMHFIRNLESKTTAAKGLLKFMPERVKKLYFCSSKKQAISMCSFRYFSKPTITPKERGIDRKVQEYDYIMANWQGDKSLNMFINNEILEMSCVVALNEGVNLGKTNIAFIVQLDSKTINFFQRLGRILGYYFGHLGNVIILVVKGTVDEEWTNKALRQIDESRIRKVSLKDILEGKEQLIINKNKQNGEQQKITTGENTAS